METQPAAGPMMPDSSPLLSSPLLFSTLQNKKWTKSLDKELWECWKVTQRGTERARDAYSLFLSFSFPTFPPTELVTLGETGNNEATNIDRFRPK